MRYICMYYFIPCKHTTVIEMSKHQSCCEYHSAINCNQGRDCPVRKHIKANPFEKFKVALVMVFILAAFGLVGEMDYQDEVAQEAPKTMIAKKEIK